MITLNFREKHEVWVSGCNLQAQSRTNFVVQVNDSRKLKTNYSRMK